jgi:hypothetical protein
MAKLRAGDISELEWMRNKTVLLIGDSIERDHVSLFCSLMGRDAEVIKGKHPLATVPESGAVAATERKKKDRAARIAYKGMQESTLPRVCYIDELNFVVSRLTFFLSRVASVHDELTPNVRQMTNLYHFGLDEQGFWKDIDQYHGPATIEERFSTHYRPFISKLQGDDRPTAPDLVEISSGMFDLARWAKQDETAGRSTKEDVNAKELEWYSKRVKAFMDTTATSWPQAVKLWRAVTVPEDQASELDYFNVRSMR